MADKYHDTVAASQVTVDPGKVSAEVARIIADAPALRSPETLRFLFSCIDLTTLRSTDSQQSVAKFTERVNAFEEEHGDLLSVAAICVYPNFAQVVRTVLEVSQVEIA